MRRDSQDQKWKKLKEEVAKRDKSCRLVAVLTAQEGYTLLKNARRVVLLTLDPAHVLPVGKYPNLCYEPKNVVLLNRWSHDCLDHNKNPINGKNITREEANMWWERIVGKETWIELLELSRRTIS